MPKGITGRILLLVIAAIATMAAVTAIVTFSGPPPFPNPVSVQAVLDRAQGLPPPRQPNPFQYAPLTARDMVVPPQIPERQFEDLASARLLARALSVAPEDVRLYRESGWRGPNIQLSRSRTGEAVAGELHGNFTFALRQGERWHVVQRLPGRWFTDWHKRLFLWLGLATIVLSSIGVALARAITGPIRALAYEAERSGIAGPDFTEARHGPAEVQQLNGAINRMRARYADAVSSRTGMLIGIAHDLGTPLARLAFRIESMPDAAREEAYRDIEDMRALIRAAMDFARGSEAPDTDIALDVLAADRVSALNDETAPVTLTVQQPVSVRGNALALSRLIDNLIGNAQRYAGAAQVMIQRVGGDALLTVKDRGPGFRPDATTKVFEPFYREEHSRNRATGGTGLGLAIARTIVEAHGGSITAENRPGGGASVEVRLPCAAYNQAKTSPNDRS